MIHPILQFRDERQRLRAMRIFIRRVSKMPAERRDQIAREFGLAGFEPVVFYFNKLKSELASANREAARVARRGEKNILILRNELRDVQ
jgi:hypothetical protein